MAPAKPPRPASGSDLDMTALLAREHRAVDELFTLLERARGAPGRRRGLAKLHDALAAHATSEESLLYRALRASLSPEGHRSVSLAHEEHHRIKDWLAQLGATSPAAPAFADLVVRLKAAVRIHVREEEQVLFPLARRVLGITRLRALGARMVASRPPRQGRKQT